MAKYSYGLSKFEVGSLKADGTPDALVDYKKQRVYKDTCVIEESDPTVEHHYSEGENTPFLSLSENGMMSVKASLTDVSADTLVKFLGGTVTTVNNKKVWHKSTAQENLEKYLKITFLDGKTFSFEPR